jgi:phosphoribosyl 1,2-cyclic phosphodiesterase
MHGVSVTILGSGSCGNSILVDSEESILIDAGISCKELERRMTIVGKDPSRVEAVVLSHEHTDHTRGAQRFCAKYGVPAYGSDGTLSLTPLSGVEMISISNRRSLSIGGIEVRPFPVKHFAAEPKAFSIVTGHKKIGIASDLGSVNGRIIDEIAGSDILLVEANYDVDMLLTGSYPDFLKRTIKSDHGHLSNDDAGLLASKAACDRTERVVLLHLSKENNTPAKARETVGRKLKSAKRNPKLDITEHGGMNGPFDL